MSETSPLVRPAGFFIGADGRIRPIWRAILYATAGLVALIAATILVLLFVEAFAPGAIQGLGSAKAMMARPMIFVAVYATSNVALLLLAWLFLTVFDRRSFRVLGIWFFAGWGREVVAGVGLGVAVLVVCVGFSVTFRAVVFQGMADLSSASLLGLAKTALLLFFAAANEEFLFRGYAFQRLVDSLGALWTVLITSALFGIAHLFNPSPTPLSTANTVLAGVLLSLAYLKTRALWLPIGLHWAWNFTMGPVLGLPVSGLNVTPTLFRAESTGPQWLGGGAYGPEGGVLMTAVCVVAILWLSRTRKIAPSPAMQEVLK